MQGGAKKVEKGDEEGRRNSKDKKINGEGNALLDLWKKGIDGY